MLALAAAIAARVPGGHVLGQFENEANEAAHETHTGPEVGCPRVCVGRGAQQRGARGRRASSLVRTALASIASHAS